MLTTSQQELISTLPLVQENSYLYKLHNQKILSVSNAKVQFLVSLLHHKKKWKIKKCIRNKFCALEHKHQKDHCKEYQENENSDAVLDNKHEQNSNSQNCHRGSKCKYKHDKHWLHNTHNNKQYKDQTYNRKYGFAKRTSATKTDSFESSSEKSDNILEVNSADTITSLSSTTTTAGPNSEIVEEEEEEPEEEEEEEEEEEHQEDEETLSKNMYKEENQYYERSGHKHKYRGKLNCEEQFMKTRERKLSYVVNREKKTTKRETKKKNINHYSEYGENASMYTRSVSSSHNSRKGDQTSLCSESTLSVSSEIRSCRKQQRRRSTFINYLAHDMPTELFAIVCSYLTNVECCTLLEVNHAMLWRMTDVDRFVWRDRALNLWHNKQAFRSLLQGTYLHLYNNIEREGEIAALQLSLLQQYDDINNNDDQEDNVHLNETNVHNFNSVCAAKGSVYADWGETNLQITEPKGEESMTKTNSFYGNNDNDKNKNSNCFNSDAISLEKEVQLDKVESLEDCKVKCQSEEIMPNKVEMNREFTIKSHASHQNKIKKRAKRNKRHAKHKNLVDISNSINNDNVRNYNGSCSSEKDDVASEIAPVRNASCNPKSIVSDNATLPKRKLQNEELENGQSKCVVVQSTTQKRFSHHHHYQHNRSNFNNTNRKTELVNSPENVHSSEYELAHHTRRSNNDHHNISNNIKGRNKCKKQKNRVKRRRQRQQRGRKSNKRKHHHHQQHNNHHHHEHHHYSSPTYLHVWESEQELYTNKKSTECHYHYNKTSLPRYHESKRRGRSCNLGARRCRSQLRSTSIKRDERNEEEKFKEWQEHKLEENELHEEEEECRMHNGRYMSDPVFSTEHSCHHNRLPRKRHSKKRHKTYCSYYCKNVNERCDEFNHKYEVNNKNKLERLPTRSALRRQRRLRHRARCLSERTTYASYHNRGALLNNAVHKSFRVSNLHFCSDGQCNCGTTPTYHAILQSKPVTFANDFEPLINAKCATLKTSINEQIANKEINKKKVVNDVEEKKTNVELQEEGKTVDASTGQTNVTTTTATAISSCADTACCTASHTNQGAHNTLETISSNNNNNSNSNRTSIADQAISNCGKLYKGLYWWQLTPESKQRYLYELKRFVLSSSKNDHARLAKITTRNSASYVQNDTTKLINADKSILPKRVKLPEPPSYRSLSELSRAAAATLSGCSSFSSSSSSFSSALYSSTWSKTDGRHPHRYRSESTNELLESSISSTNSSCSEVHPYDDMEYGDGNVDKETNEEGTHRKTHLSEEENEEKYQKRIARQNKHEEENYCTDYECDEYAEREEAMLLTRAKASLIYELKKEQTQNRSFGVNNDSNKNSSRFIRETEFNVQGCNNELKADHVFTDTTCALPNSACVANRFAYSTLANINTTKSTTKTKTTALAREQSTELLLLPANQITSPPVNSPSNICSKLCATVPSRNTESVEITNDNVNYTPICSDNIHHGTNETNYNNNNNNNDNCKSDAAQWEPTSWKFAYFMSIREARRSLLTMQDLIDNTWLICFKPTGSVHSITFGADHTLTVGSGIYNKSNNDKCTTPFIAEHTSNTRNNFEHVPNYHHACLLPRVHEEQHLQWSSQDNQEKHIEQDDEKKNKQPPKLYFQLLQGGAVLHVANLQPLRVSRRVNLHVLNKDKYENNTNNNFVRNHSSDSVTISNKGPALFHAEPVRTLTRINHWLDDKVLHQHKKTSIQEWLNSQMSFETDTAEFHESNTSRACAQSTRESNNTSNNNNINSNKHEAKDSVNDDWGWTLANATVKIFSIDAQSPDYVNYLRHPWHNRANRRMHDVNSLYTV